MTIDPMLQIAAGVLDDGEIDLYADLDALPEISGEDYDHHRGNYYPDSVHLYALRVWVFEAGMNAAKTTRIVNDRTGLAINVDTIRRWSVREDWEARGSELHQSAAHTLLGNTKARLAYLQSKAVDALDDVLSGRGNPLAYSAQTKAASLVLGLGGFVPPIHGNTVNVAVNMDRGYLADKSDEELRDIQASYTPDQNHTPNPDITEAEYRIAHQQAGHTLHLREQPQRYTKR